MIMPRLGMNLENYFEKVNWSLPEISIYSLAIKIVTLLECVHKIGLIFNDLKLDNLMVQSDDHLPESDDIDDCTDVFENCTISLVDFGFVSSVVDKHTRQHVEQTEVETFRGNIMFASMNQLNFTSTSRRDDMIAMCYLVIYMLNEAYLPGVSEAELVEGDRQK